MPNIVTMDILVNAGKVVEYDSPAKLLKDKSSEFSNLVMEFLQRSNKASCSLDLA